MKNSDIRESVEQMFAAMRETRYIDMPFCDDKIEKREGENEELFELRKQSRELEKELEEKKRNACLDSFIEGLCSFIEMKYGMEPKDDKY